MAESLWLFLPRPKLSCLETSTFQAYGLHRWPAMSEKQRGGRHMKTLPRQSLLNGANLLMRDINLVLTENACATAT